MRSTQPHRDVDRLIATLSDPRKPLTARKRAARELGAASEQVGDAAFLALNRIAEDASVDAALARIAGESMGPAVIRDGDADPNFLARDFSPAAREGLFAGCWEAQDGKPGWSFGPGTEFMRSELEPGAHRPRRKP